MRDTYFPPLLCRRCRSEIPLPPAAPSRRALLPTAPYDLAYSGPHRGPWFPLESRKCPCAIEAGPELSSVEPPERQDHYLTGMVGPVPCPRQLESAVTTKGDEVKMPKSVDANQSLGHERREFPTLTLQQRRAGSRH